MMRRPPWLLLALLLIPPPARAAPPVVPRGFKAAGKPASYDARGLYRAIDGAAELYLSYGFRRLDQRGLRRGKLELSVQRYDMGSPLNAFGIFGRERPDEAAAVEAGAGAAAVVPHQCLGHRGRHYLKLTALQGQLTRDLCRDLLRALLGALPGKDDPPPELKLLPGAGRVPGSARYTRRSHLGLGELQDCLHARYRRGKRSFQMFVMLPGDRGLKPAWSQLAGRWKTAPGTPGQKQVLYRKVPYTGLVAATRTRDAILGAAGVGDLAATARLLRRRAGNPDSHPGGQTRHPRTTKKHNK
jgi:hypothetical protein